MPTQDAYDQPSPVEPYDSVWVPPPPHPLRMRERVALVMERFGFWIVCALVAVALVFLFLNADWILQGEQTPTPSATLQEVPEEGRGTPAVMTREAAEEPEPEGRAGVTLSVITEPLQAVIFADGDYLGVSPVQEVVLTEGRHLISVLKPDYTQRDTVVLLAEVPVALHLILAAEEDAMPPEAPVATAGHDEVPIPSTLSDATPESRRREPPPAAEPPDEEPPPIADTEETQPVEEAPVVERGDLRIDSVPSGASVWIAGRDVGVTPLLLPEIEAGPMPVTLRLDGYEDFTTTVDVAAGRRNTVLGQLKRGTGTLRILVKPWGTIYIDDELHRREAAIWYTATLNAGYHRVRVEHPSLGRWEQVVEVLSGEERSFTIDFNEE